VAIAVAPEKQAQIRDEHNAALPAGAASPPGGGAPPRDMREALRQNPGLAERIVKSAIIDGELAKKTNDEIADLLLEHVWADVETFTAKAGLLEIAIERLRAGGFAAGWKAALEQGAGLVDHDENIPAAFAARLRALAAAPPPPGTAPPMTKCGRCGGSGALMSKGPTVPCWACGGTGRVPQPDAPAPAAVPAKDTPAMKCPECGSENVQLIFGRQSLKCWACANIFALPLRPDAAPQDTPGGTACAICGLEEEQPVHDMSLPRGRRWPGSHRFTPGPTPGGTGTAGPIPCECGRAYQSMKGWKAQGLFEDLHDGSVMHHALPPGKCITLPAAPSPSATPTGKEE